MLSIKFLKNKNDITQLGLTAKKEALFLRELVATIKPYITSQSLSEAPLDNTIWVCDILESISEDSTPLKNNRLRYMIKEHVPQIRNGLIGFNFHLQPNQQFSREDWDEFNRYADFVVARMKRTV